MNKYKKNSIKSVGGITLAGILVILFEVANISFDIYQYNQPDTKKGIEQSIKNMEQLGLDMDSIRENVKDTILRDSLLQERARNEILKIGSTN